MASLTLQKPGKLHAHAIPFGGILGRLSPEPEDSSRSPFQRDRGRIIQTQAFRRLQGKTQVFVAGKNDHYRTRLTHTLEVACISRDLARTLGLNEDLSECIALAHDLGHPPFGHTGEEALNEWMKQFDAHFEHNEQSLRIVTILESHSPYHKGLNLNREVLQGLQKHDLSRNQRSLEAELVNLSDEIAYNAHDCEDALDQKIFTIDALLTVPLAKRAHDHRLSRKTSLRGAMIDLLVQDVCSASSEKIITFSPSMRRALKELRSFLWTNMCLHPSVRKPADAGKNVLLLLCNRLYKKPTSKIQMLAQSTGAPLHEAVKDYIAGMTDTFAKQYVKRT